MSLTTDHDDDLRVAVPDYDIIDTLGQSFGRQHARYRIVCKEGGHVWEVQRRWTELRVTIDALKATHINAFSAPSMGLTARMPSPTMSAANGMCVPQSFKR